MCWTATAFSIAHVGAMHRFSHHSVLNGIRQVRSACFILSPFVDDSQASRSVEVPYRASLRVVHRFPFDVAASTVYDRPSCFTRRPASGCDFGDAELVK